jgi:predicted ATPase
MKITIENFGAIKHFVFDTEKDLTLIFGKNSVGKSYAISLVYLILKNTFTTSDSMTDALKFTTEALKATNSSVSIDDVMSFYTYAYSIGTPLSESIKNTFGDLKNIANQLSKKSFKLTIKHTDFSAILTLDIEEDRIRLTNLDPANFTKHSGLGINNIYYLPASRSGLYHSLNAFGEIFAELSKNRSISSKIGLTTIAEPLLDYYLHLSRIDTTNENSDFAEYVNEIEQEILNGKVEFNHQTKKIYFIPNDTSLKLDLSATSSMVSEIAPIVSYLKHVLAITYVKENKQVPILFIEEPEAHLHPETQVKLMRVFARLVKDNKIKLVMTSHSNYIFNAASNLVMDNKIPIDKFEAVLFEMTEEGSVARPMATDEYGIDDDNFIDTAEALYEERIAIINKKNGY